MASRYTAEALLQLRQSPLCVKPPGLPPADQWMGPVPDPNTRAQTTGNRPLTSDRVKSNEGTFSLDPASRRQTGDRHNPRNLSSTLIMFCIVCCALKPPADPSLALALH
ncbi:uncharacterized protein SPSK_03722 [Sporothrix schenckii 1099-18]|uniref:Uncharacterized protein n=1 Tax=Sporothrix schenckii 1099-18 TaxID=1397361 RepID=A0A0F2LXT7_SPOSC|nr:uncharacterized protein SPSK_03722 [Sporothrix schenckii 1099-18]KJR82282.1 hypothetical protein SPSK_03722 [Sporothrix schenckii 1099-18]